MNFEEMNKELREKSTKHQSNFSSGLIPGSLPILGVRIPQLREMAKKYAKEDWKYFMTHSPVTCFEHQSLKAFVLGYAKDDIDEILSYADQFVPTIRDWSVNDSFCQTFKIARKEPVRVWEWMKIYAAKNEEYAQRMSAVLSLSQFLNEEYIDRVLELMNQLSYPGYYTKMGVAWCVATAYAKFPQQTGVFLKDNKLDDWTYNKSIQKMIESYRVPEEKKEMLRSMKR